MGVDASASVENEKFNDDVSEKFFHEYILKPNNFFRESMIGFWKLEGGMWSANGV
jgi:hypothetical protein